MTSEICCAFEKRFGRVPAVVARAPGRLELLGNHTDYNEGLVISCATDCSTYFAAAPASDERCTVVSVDETTDAFFNPASLGEPVPGEWANYVKGVVHALQQRGYVVRGFDGMIMSTVPRSAGMSSSAALEVATAFALGTLNNIELSTVEWAKVGQQAENEFVGANTGLLDQLTSICGKANHLVLCDFRHPSVQVAPFGDTTVFVVADTGVKHDLTADYNLRRSSCEHATATIRNHYPHVSALRDVSSELLTACKPLLDDVTYRRARHIVGENERVEAGINLLSRGELVEFGQLLFASHASSRYNFENSCPELDILVEIARSLPGCYGARLSGGGFGGISIHLVERDAADEYSRRLATAYETRTGSKPEMMICAIGEGAKHDV